MSSSGDDFLPAGLPRLLVSLITLAGMISKAIRYLSFSDFSKFLSTEELAM